MIRPPAPRPCVSCPYRLDVPSGVWDRSEYEKLPMYDGETWEQIGPDGAPGVFMCHQQDDRLCAGWVGCHDMSENLAFRLAARLMDEADVDAVLDYTTPVPLFKTGSEAAEHGLRDIDSPPPDAVKIIRKLNPRG